MSALEKVSVIPQVESTENAPVQSESAAIINMIERASRDPAVDIDKFQRLMEMRKTIETESAERAFNSAMKAAQSEMGRIAADAENKQTHSRYATYAKLDSVLRPIYTKHGFSLSFDEGESPKPEHIRCLCYVSHEAGFTRTYRKDLPADGKGAKGGDVMTKTHATGAASSYGARYLLKGIFNVAIGEEDRDGNEATSDPISQGQYKQIIALADDVGADKRKFCAYFKIDGIAHLPASEFDYAVSLLEAKRGK